MLVTRKRPSQAAQRAAKIARLDNMLSARGNYYVRPRRLPVAEPGYVDLAVATYALNTTGSLTLVATIPQGASVNQRIGKKARLDKVHMRGVASADTTTTVTKGACILVYDKKPAGSLPTITEYLDSISPNSFTLDANRDRFVTLWRQEYAFQGNITTPATGSEYFTIDKVVNVNKPIIFKAAGTGAIGDIETGALYFITVGNVAAGTADANATVGFRTIFHDV